MKRLVIVAALLALSACAGVDVQPIPPPVQQPAYVADFSGPTLGLALTCTGDVPVDCSSLPPGAKWGTFDWPASPVGCADPNSVCYTIPTPGVFQGNATNPGFPIIAPQTFPLVGSIRARGVFVADVCPDPGCWGGLVLYDGDAVHGQPQSTGRWRGIYYSVGPTAGTLNVGVWGPAYLQQLFAVPVGSEHVFELTYRAADQSWTYQIDGVAYPIQEHDPTALPDPPHLAIFMGLLPLRARDVRVYLDP